MNLLITLLTIVVYFSLVILLYKLWGKTGLYLWIAISILFANIEVGHFVTIFALPLTLGNVLYGSTFLATDILTEKYGKKAANTSVFIGFFSLFFLLIAPKLALAFTTDNIDFYSAFKVVFASSTRFVFASFLTYITSQFFDIWVFTKIKQKTGEKYLWLRNNGSTLLSQLLDTAMFTLLAFLGTESFEFILALIGTSYVAKIVISLLDTPFFYIANSITPKNEL